MMPEPCDAYRVYDGQREYCVISPMGHRPPHFFPGPEEFTDPEFIVKDSGKRESYESGMVRDTAEGKIDYSLVYDGPMLKRWAEHLTKGAKKYAVRNWMKATGEAELERFRESAARHFAQWMEGEVDEDHAAAVLFNINGYEYVRGQ